MPQAAAWVLVSAAVVVMLVLAVLAVRPVMAKISSSAAAK